MSPEAEPSRVLIGSRAEYLDGSDRLYALAQQEICIFDPDLQLLELNTLSRITALHAFLAGHPDRSLRIALHDPAYAEQNCPRLLDLLRQFAPRLTIYRSEGMAARAQDSFVLADRHHFVRRAVAAQARGVLALEEAREGHQLQERFEEIWALCVPAITASTLGL